MIRLGSPAEPQWHELTYGVRIFAALLDPLAEMAATQAFRRVLREGARDEDDEPDLARAELEGIVSSAQRTVKGWSGVEDMEGRPLPCTPENLAALLRGITSMATAYDNAVMAARLAWSAEKNASPSSPNGTGASRAAPPIAETAAS